jgi:hypothetical protein
MVLQRKRSLSLGLGLSMALVFAVALPATSSAQSTLTGQNLNGSSLQGNSLGSPNCDNSTYSISGTATGPYPGTFTEAGSFSTSTPIISATFTITSGTTTITGSKSAPPSPGAQGSCEFVGGVPVIGGVFFDSTHAIPYTATIHNPNGTFHDEGTTSVGVAVEARIGGAAATIAEFFTSSLTEPVLIPGSKDQCKKGGWQAFPQFKNQGQCVSFVEHQPRT